MDAEPSHSHRRELACSRKACNCGSRASEEANADSSVDVDAADEALEDPNKEDAEGTAILTCGGALDASDRQGWECD